MKELLFTLIGVLAVTVAKAEWLVYQDETYKVNYSYNPETLEARVKAGSYTGTAGSPDASGAIVIPPSLSIDGTVYPVTRIPAYAFIGQKNITSVEIQGGVKSIGQQAFINCTNLATVSLGNSVNSIEKSAFSSCSALTSISLGNSLTSIGQYAFYKCTALTSIEFPSSLESMDINAFYGCSNLTTVVFAQPSSLKAIPYGAFAYCKALTKIDIPDSVTEMDEIPFQGCSDLVEATIPSSLKVIPFGAFRECTNLTSLTLHEGVTEIGGSAFSSTGITEMNIPNTVTTIGEAAFSNCASLSSIDVPSSVVNIGAGAFSGSAVKSVTFSCPVIVPSMFKGCAKLESITIPEGVSSIQQNAFNGCTSLLSVTIPNSVVSIDKQVFAGCSALKEIQFGNSVKTIGSSAFQSCTSLESIVLPNSLEVIVESAFNGCTGLTAVSLGSSLNEIGPSAFLNCSSLKSIVIPENVNKINAYAFQGCKKLESISIPPSLKQIGRDAFRNCTKLSSVYITDLAAWCGINFSYDYVNNQSGGGSASANPLNNQATLYVNDEPVKKLVIPDGVTAISDYAFIKCSSIQSVKFPPSVTSIGRTAFAECPHLTTVYVQNKTAPSLVAYTNRVAFYPFNKTKIVSVYIPYATKSDYTEKWSSYKGQLYEIPYAWLIVDEERTSASSLSQLKDAFREMNGSAAHIDYVDLTTTTLEEDVTAETLRQGDPDASTLYYLPTGTGISGKNIVADGQASEIELDNGVPVTIPQDFTAAQVHYARNFPRSSADAYTLCLPYDCEVPEGLTAYALREQDGEGCLVFSPVTAIEANKPYLVTASADVEGLSATGVTVRATPDVMPDGGVAGYELRGTLQAISNAEAAAMGAYVLQAGLEWHPVSTGTPEDYIPAGRAYLVPTAANAGSRLVTRLTGDRDSAISIVTSDAAAASATGCHDLQGRRLSGQPVRGLYVSEGKVFNVR